MTDVENFLSRQYTALNLETVQNKLPSRGVFYFAGSCFAHYLHEKLKDRGLNAFEAPFGNMYNPHSLFSNMERLLDERYLEEEEIFIHDGLWKHYAFHSLVCKTDKQLFIEECNNQIKKHNNILKETTGLILTWGTSWVYEKKGSGIVNNCHKQPASDFSRRCLTYKEIYNKASLWLEKFNTINQKASVIMTLSPVRHIKDGLSVNSHSKAILRCVLQKLHDEKKMTYFPSYEILIDELRDYRWYGEDLVHPTDKTVSYICERFTNAYIKEDFQTYSAGINKLQKALNHRYLIEPSQEIKDEQKNRLLMQLAEIKKDFPEMNNLEMIKQKILNKFH